MGVGVCLSACWDNTPRSRHCPLYQAPPLGADTPQGPGTPWDQASLPEDQAPPGAGTPLRSACWEMWSTSGRYASFWNAILFYIRQMTTKASNVLGTIVFNSTRVNGHEEHTWRRPWELVV